MTFKILNTGDGSLIINGLKVSGIDSSFFLKLRIINALV